MEKYNEIIQYSNIDVAVCDIVDKKSGIFMPFFENFYPFIKENFLINYNKLIEFAEEKNIENNFIEHIVITGIYAMKVWVDYNKVIEKLKISKKNAEIVVKTQL